MKIEVQDYGYDHSVNDTIDHPVKLSKAKRISISYDGGRFSIYINDELVDDTPKSHDFSITITD